MNRYIFASKSKGLFSTEADSVSSACRNAWKHCNHRYSRENNEMDYFHYCGCGATDKEASENGRDKILAIWGE